ncbi:MAG TPA: GNAT family N-acetyltransferase [Mycobacteriales bacterium]|jgi:ribosomal protein S18 acetylase RimI-like enzyme|nr:GNAT family N-acetyltransferase [Mycobacteriales bacterium]
MARSQVVTRMAAADDIPALMDLWDELRQVGGRGERANNPVSTIDVRERLEAVLASPSYRIVLASLEDAPAGMAVLQTTRPDPFADSRVLNIAHLVVSRTAQHRGVGHALLKTAVDFATEKRLDQVSVSIYPSLREASRFFARLGFAPAATRRVAPVSLLRRRLGADAGVPADAMRRRTRLVRSVPSPRARRGAAAAADGVATRRAAAR